MRWKVKMGTNDDMRQTFLDMYVPKIWDLGLTLPDPNLKKNAETGKWEYTEPDWDEFFDVLRGNGGTDGVSYADSAEGVTISLATGFTLGGDASAS